MALQNDLLLITDYLLTLIWLKGSLLVLACALLSLPLARRSASAVSAWWTLAAAGLLIVPLAHRLLPRTGPAVVEYPAFLFDWDARELAGTVGQTLPAAADGFLGWAASAPLAIWLGVVWIAGTVLLLGRFASQLLQVRRIARAAESVPGRVAAATLADARDRRLLSRVRVAYSAAVASPVTFGWRRPVVLLPLEARAWSHAWRRAALVHELAHIRRRDYPALVLAEIVRALYWPNPLVWRLVSVMRSGFEHACDDAVLRAGIDPYAYARHLVALAACERRTSSAGALAMMRRSGLRARIDAILDDAADRAPASGRLLLAAGVLGIALASGLGAAGMWSCAAASVGAGPVVAPRA